MRSVALRLPNTRSAMAGGVAVRAWVSLLMLTVIAFAPLMASFHQASVRHVRCEHGDLIEPEDGREDGGSGALTARGDFGAEARSAPGIEIEIETGATASVHEHRHCAVASLMRTAGTRLACSPVCALAQSALVVELLDLCDAPARPVLASAPKTSPPAWATVSLLS